MADGAERVRLTVEHGVATIAMVREGRMNAFDQAMHDGLRTALDAVRADDAVRCVVLTGTGRAFSAGQDLGERAAVFEAGGQPDLSASLDTNYNPLIRAIAALPVPVIAAVNGIAFGAGAALAIACDIVLAAASARFQFGFVNVGLGPDSGASWFLPRLAGPARALDLVLTGRPVNADEAAHIGLVSRLVPDGELAATAHAIAADLALRSPDALAAVKLRSNPLGSLEAALDAEREAQGALGQTQDYREAVLRFTRKSS
jgi:2-(1,2-epoxy-1,2-dihydrophenyl)acetyl-CoA isomerase